MSNAPQTTTLSHGHRDQIAALALFKDIPQLGVGEWSSCGREGSPGCPVPECFRTASFTHPRSALRLEGISTILAADFLARTETPSRIRIVAGEANDGRHYSATPSKLASLINPLNIVIGQATEIQIPGEAAHLTQPLICDLRDAQLLIQPVEVRRIPSKVVQSRPETHHHQRQDSPRRSKRTSLHDRQTQMKARLAIESVKPPSVASGLLSLEPHYKPKDLAKLWAMDYGSVLRLFRDEPGVLTLDRPEEKNKRGYRSIYIPVSVAERVHDRIKRQKRS
jgi:hypothetical protein